MSVPPVSIMGKRIPLLPHGMDPNRKLGFVCLGSKCENTCCGPFHGTRALEAVTTRSDLGAVVAGEDQSSGVSIFAEIRLTEADVQRLQHDGYDDLIVRRSHGTELVHYMKLLADGTCAALDSDRMCSIHPSRPTLCRAFPFYFDLFAGLSMVSSCPGVGAGEQTVRELRGEIDAATTMYEFWIDEIRGAKPSPESGEK